MRAEHPTLDLTIAYLQAGLDAAAQEFLDDTLYYMRRGWPLSEAALVASGNIGKLKALRKGTVAGWRSAWVTTGQEVIAALKQRQEFRDALRAMNVTQLAEAPGAHPLYTTPRPLDLPAGYRTWEETHPADAPRTSRATWEWLAEHEATLQRFTPQEYIGLYLQHRTPPLAGVVDRALLDETRNIAAGIAERGFGVKQAMAALRSQFPEFTRHRLENIARTEGAVLFETGRLARYREDAAVTGVRYDAVGDSRTTEICRWHDGRFYQLDKPHPTPPLHYQCRSTLAPVLFDEDVKWEQAQPPPKARPMTGFGVVEQSLLPPNVELAARAA